MTFEHSKLEQHPKSGHWWTTLDGGVELVFEVSSPPDDALLRAADMAVESLDELIVAAIRYIDIWVDRTRPGTGLAYEIRSISLTALDPIGMTTLGFYFPADDNSFWWVRFGNPNPTAPPNIPHYWPVSFGREQE